MEERHLGCNLGFISTLEKSFNYFVFQSSCQQNGNVCLPYLTHMEIKVIITQIESTLPKKKKKKNFTKHATEV